MITKAEHGNIRNSVGFYCIWGIITGSIFVIIPLYTNELNFTVYQISLFVAIPNFTLLFQPVWAFVIDYFQKPAFIVQIATIISAMSLIVLSQSTTFGLIFLAYFIYSLFINPMWTTIDNQIFVRFKNSSVKYEKVRCFASYSYGLSVLILVPILVTVSKKSYFIIAAVLYMFIVYIIGKIPTSKIENDQVEKIKLRDILKGLLKKRYVTFVIFTCFYGALLPLTIPYQTLLLEEKGYSLVIIGIATLVTTLLEGLLLNKGSRVFAKYGLKKALYLASVFLLIRAIILGFSKNILFILIGCSFYGLSTCVYIPVLMNYIHEVIDFKLSNTALMFISFITSLGAVVISLVASTYVDIYGVKSFYFINVVIIFASICVVPFLKEEENKVSKEKCES